MGIRSRSIIHFIALTFLAFGLSALARAEDDKDKTPSVTKQDIENYMRYGKEISETLNPTPKCTSPTEPQKKKRSWTIQVGAVITYGRSGAKLEESYDIEPPSVKTFQTLNYTLHDRLAHKSVGNMVEDEIRKRHSQGNGNILTVDGQDPDALLRTQLRASLLIRGMATFFDPTKTGEEKQDSSKQAAQWAADQLKQMGASDAETFNIVAMVLNRLNGNYYGLRNPGESGATNETRTLDQMSRGFVDIFKDGEKNSNGGVCDDIAAAGCQIYNKFHNYKPNDPMACKLVGIQDAGVQHWVARIPNGDNSYTLLNYNTVTKIKGEGASISYPGNPSPIVPVMMVGEDGAATIVDFEDGELEKFIHAFTGTQPLVKSGSGKDIASPPDEAEFQGSMRAAKLAFELTKRKGVHKITVGAGSGKLSLQNEGAEVYGVFLKIEDASNLEEAKKKLENNFKATGGGSNKILVTYNKISGDSATKVVEIDERFAGIYVQQLGPIRLELSAGADLKMALMMPEETPALAGFVAPVGYSGAGNFFGNATVSGSKQINDHSAISGYVAFTVSGIPGLVLSKMHGIGSGEKLNSENIQGFYAHYKAEGAVQYQIDQKNAVGAQASYTRTPASGQSFNMGVNYQYVAPKFISNTSAYASYSPDSPLFKGAQVGAKEQVTFNLKGKKGYNYSLTPNAFFGVSIPDGQKPYLGTTGVGFNFGFGK